MDYLNELNPRQHMAVTADSGQTLVLAGPGSGKTRVLTYRIAYLVQAMGVRPYHILAVTFTNKAAREMGARLANLLDSSVNDLWLGTFHAMCARLLRREADYLPFSNSFVIMDADDQLQIIKQAIKDLNLEKQEKKPTFILTTISNAKNDLIQPQDFIVDDNDRKKNIPKIYKRYQELLKISNAVDFDDLLLWAVRLLQENPAVKENYNHRFEHILVDEFQDTNRAQYELLRLLAGPQAGMFVVGDEDQSIYRWRGADYHNVERFQQDYPQAAKILLEQNYRSTQTVLDAARAVIDRNTHRTRKKLFSDRGKGERIICHEAKNGSYEANYVVDTIQRLIKNREIGGGDVAIMYRTNAQSRLLEEAFIRQGMPYRLVGAQRFYGRSEVKDIIAFLRLIQNPIDEISLLRVINIPPRDIGTTTQSYLVSLAHKLNLSAGDLILDLATFGSNSQFAQFFKTRKISCLSEFGKKIRHWQEQNENENNLVSLFDLIISDVNYQEYLSNDTEKGTERWENVQELRRLAIEYQERGLTDFLETIALVADQDTLSENGNVPTLLTLHAAKGLEFSHVFIVGLDEGLLPHSRSFGDEEEMAEERRLLYVGMTRARNRLYLVRAKERFELDYLRTENNRYEFGTRSRFLIDIPAELVQTTSPSHVTAYRMPAPSWNEARQPQNTFQRQAAASAPPAQQRFKPMMRVRHVTFGDGVVLESRLEDGDETVSVHFESVGLKRLAASLANLEIIL
jgi:DNA helicase-2/ATP-dependent DNA helicase PcrA